MEKEPRFEMYPRLTVLLCTLVTLSIYGLGTWILSGLGWWVAGLYLFFCFWLEWRVLKKSCVNCVYFGKRCGLGKGKWSAALFKQGEGPRAFALKTASCVDVLPDLLVSLVPLFTGTVLSFVAFSWLRLLAMSLLVLVGFGGNAAVRGVLLCKYCKQAEIGCPAQKLFERIPR